MLRSNSPRRLSPAGQGQLRPGRLRPGRTWCWSRWTRCARITSERYGVCRRRDAVSRPPGPGRSPVRAGLLGRAADPALPFQPPRRACCRRTTGCATTAPAPFRRRRRRSPPCSPAAAGAPAPSWAPSCSTAVSASPAASTSTTTRSSAIPRPARASKPSGRGATVVDRALAWLGETSPLKQARPPGRSSFGSTSTTPTLPIRRRRLGASGIPAGRTTARSPPSTRRSGGCWPSSTGAASPAAPSSPSPPTTARGSASTAS